MCDIIESNMESKSSDHETSLVMDTSGTDAFDLSMYLDVMDELCRTQINPTTINEVAHITEKMARLCRENQTEISQHNLDASSTNNFFLDDQCADFDGTNRFDPDLNNDPYNVRIVDELKDVFAYFDEDVQSAGPSTPSSTPDLENTKRNTPIVEKLNRSFRSKVKTVKAKSKCILNSIRSTNRKVGRLRGSLINLFEDAKCGRNVAEPRLKIRKTDSMLTIDRNNNYASTEPEFKVPKVPAKPKETIEEILENEKQFFRQHSKRKFEESRQNLETFFSEKMPVPTNETLKQCDRNESDQFSVDDCQLSKFCDKLTAIETFVQTQQFLQRIRYLVKAITHLDETRMTTMNLERLRNFLIFIRDCSNDCQNVCASISEYILSDLENCAMTQKELYYYLTAISLKVYIGN